MHRRPRLQVFRQGFGTGSRRQTGALTINQATMCGIYGFRNLSSSETIPIETLRRMASLTIHRGPDDDGTFVDGGVMLGMRRLAILDVRGGHQPLANEDGTVHIICNGEIYNYRALTAELHGMGHHLKTRSDSEVIVHLYEQYGDDFVRRLEGMFAFALWDSRQQRLLLGRDRLGIKPLYYLEARGHLLFASEAKALLVTGLVSPEVNRQALQEYLALGYTPGSTSMFHGVRKLPPGSLMVCERGTSTMGSYWAVPEVSDAGRSEEEWAAAFLTTMDRAVESQMVSDVPLGAFLSGGIDSSTIVALMARHSSQPTKTYSIGFDTSGAGGYYNELPWAREVAKRYGTDHHEIVVKPDVSTLLPRLVWHLDEPIADAAFVTTYLVADFARRDVTVILSGIGGDELFGGYRRYLGPAYDRYYEYLPGWIRSNVLPALARTLPSDRHSSLLNVSRQFRAYVLSQHLPLPERYRTYVQVFSRLGAAALLRDPVRDPLDTIAAAFRAAPNGEPLDRMARVDLQTQLPDDLLFLTDRMTMATSLECRVPFLDERVVNLALRMPAVMKIRGRELKYVLKRALSGVLPADVLRRGKRGFGAPMGAWLKAELAPLMERLLSRASVNDRGLLRWEPIAETIALHKANREDHSDHLLALMMFEVWARLYLDARSVDDVTAELATP
jgi:asparagine synthase (glutamine-hydrolysing)